ncbi:metal ABC transporter substrate-binding protein [Butyrivibrio sp. AE2032]|uniref:metal ABC transporter substrate-binding protein n=1 Tax=Butyrivibrio sp. AE2032 TaxID=1458463 RepID=UPI000AC424A4|nr:metal ABC transporter substrate-binding protein [Butyrivibrio sp. AE2032]
MRFIGTHNLKKTITAMLTAGMLFASCACSAAGSGSGNGNGGRLKVVATVFSGYDWVREIAGDRINDIDLTLLLDNGADMHSFQPTAKDIINISSCDVFVYVGGESDGWVEDALKEAVNKDMQVVNMMELLDGRVVEEEIVEGMETEACEDNDEAEYDEHVWLSLKNAQVIVTGIAGAMEKADPANGAAYKKNAGNYNKKLAELDGKYAEAVKNGSKDTVLFGDRFPFRYLTDDYGLNYYAAFAGCSAETEASFETVVFLAGKLDELGLKVVLVIEGPDHKVAQTIADNTKSKDQEILVMDSIQSTTSSDSRNGVTYISIMESNLEVLRKALG